MKAETEVQIVMTLDNMITKIDNVIDELDDVDSPAVEKAKTQLINMTGELYGLIDRLADEGTYPSSGAI